MLQVARQGSLNQNLFPMEKKTKIKMSFDRPSPRLPREVKDCVLESYRSSKCRLPFCNK